MQDIDGCEGMLDVYGAGQDLGDGGIQGTVGLGLGLRATSRCELGVMVWRTC